MFYGFSRSFDGRHDVEVALGGNERRPSKLLIKPYYDNHCVALLTVRHRNYSVTCGKIIWTTGLFIGTIFISSIASYCACVCVRLDSENTAVTLSALLASLNSCCNPWIYMGFSGHLLQDFAHCFPCCHKIQQRFRKEDSDSSLRRTTLLTKIVNRSPTCSSGTWKEFDHSPNTSRSAPAET